MTIREAGKGIVKKAYGCLNTYRIGFVNNEGAEDQTELDAVDMKDLETLWKSLCLEFNCNTNSVFMWRRNNGEEKGSRICDYKRGL